VSLFKKKSRALRLLPGVVLVCGGLLILKTSGLVHDAIALENAPPAADAMAAAPAAVNPDFGGSDSQISSAAEVDVLTSLSKRRATLDAREAQIASQATMLAATEARVDSKIAQLKNLQDQIAALLVQRDAAQEKQVAALVKTYSAMKPASAARIFDSLDDGVLVPVAQEMKSEVMAPVLAAMNPNAAQKLTLKLANKLALPDAGAAPVSAPAPASAPVPALAPALAPAASAAPAQPEAAAAPVAAPPAKPKA
jgi:flagellar motility protein MotE (MotC chaperone)